MKINDVVTWYDMYLEQIVKDSGLGSIVEIDCYTTDGYETRFYKVWRFYPYNDFFIFEEYQLEAVDG
jgi:hypothetical protein